MLTTIFYQKFVIRVDLGDETHFLVLTMGVALAIKKRLVHN